MDEAQKPYKAYAAHAVLALAVFLAFVVKNVSFGSGGVEGKGRGHVAASQININTATAAELTILPGIGEKLAARIVEYRQNYGAFVSIDDLEKVRGIGSAKLEAVRPLVRVNMKEKGEMESNAGTSVR